MAFVQPHSAKAHGSGLPACPDPIIIASYFTRGPVWLLQPIEQVITHTERVCHDCECGIDGSARGKEPAVNDIEIVEIVRLTIRVERRCLRIVPKTNRPVLMGDPGQWNALPDKQIARKQSFMTLVPMIRARRLVLHEMFELRYKPLVAFLVVRLVGKRDLVAA